MSRRAVGLAALGGIAAGGLLWLGGAGRASDGVFALTAAVVLVPLAWSVARSVLSGDVGVDAIALVAIAGALALGEYVAGAVVALMLAGGNALEESANRRARPRASIAAPPFTITPARAARDTPEMNATGAARMSGHGVATTNTARARTASPLAAQAVPATSAVSGRKNAA